MPPCWTALDGHRSRTSRHRGERSRPQVRRVIEPSPMPREQVSRDAGVLGATPVCWGRVSSRRGRCSRGLQWPPGLSTADRPSSAGSGVRSDRRTTRRPGSAGMASREGRWPAVARGWGRRRAGREAWDRASGHRARPTRLGETCLGDEAHCRLAVSMAAVWVCAPQDRGPTRQAVRAGRVGRATLQGPLRAGAASSSPRAGPMARPTVAATLVPAVAPTASPGAAVPTASPGAVVPTGGCPVRNDWPRWPRRRGRGAGTAGRTRW